MFPDGEIIAAQNGPIFGGRNLSDSECDYFLMLALLSHLDDQRQENAGCAIPSVTIMLRVQQRPFLRGISV